MALYRTFLLLLATVCGVLTPIFIGHALAAHTLRPVIGALVLLALAFLLAFAFLRSGPGDRREAH